MKNDKPDLFIIKATIFSEDSNVFRLAKENDDRIFVRYDPDEKHYNWITRIRQDNNAWHVALIKPPSFRTFDGGSDLVSAEIFLDFLKRKYPKDLEWIMWHPEIFDGKFNE